MNLNDGDHSVDATVTASVVVGGRVAEKMIALTVFSSCDRKVNVHASRIKTFDD